MQVLIASSTNGFRDGDDTGVPLTMKLKCGVKRPYRMNMDVIMEFSE